MSIGRKDGEGGGSEGDGGEGEGGGVGGESVGVEGEGGEGKGGGGEGVGGEKGGEGQQPRVTPPLVGQQSPARLEHAGCNAQAAIAMARLPPRLVAAPPLGCRCLSPPQLSALHTNQISPLSSPKAP